MFSRTRTLVHVCSRCQRSIARQSRPPEIPRAHLFNRRSLRQQTTAAARVEEDDHDHLNPPPTGALPPEKAKPPRTSKSQRLKRKWRPTLTADLGMSALGRPTEIILLQQQDREIPVVPVDSDQGVKESLHASLTSEKQPLSWEQTKDNINQVRDQLAQRRGQLSREQWTALQTTLLEGFKGTQMKRYLQELGSQNRVSLPTSQRIGRAGKTQVVYWIATRIWGYEAPVDVLKHHDTDIADVPGKTKIILAKVLLPAMQYRMKEVAELYGARIFMAKDHIQIEGSRKEVGLASKDLRAFAKSLTCTTIDRDPWLRQLVSSPMLDSLVESLRLKYRVHIQMQPLEQEGSKTKNQKKRRKFLVWHPREQGESFGQVRRDLRMAAASSINSDVPSMPLIESRSGESQNLIMAPCYTNGVMPWDDVGPRYRLYDINSPSDTSGVPKRHHQHDGRVMGAVKSALAMVPSGPSRKPSSHVHLEFFASYGQILFKHTLAERGSFVTVDQKKDLSRSIFTTEPALVPQLLLTPKFQETADGSNVTDHRHVLARMRLSPNDLNSKFPSFEVILHGSNAVAGLDQPFTVARTWAVIEEKTFHVPRPSKAVDIKFTRRAKVDLANVQSQAEAQLPSSIEELIQLTAASQTRPLSMILPISNSWVQQIKDIMSIASTKDPKNEDGFELVEYIQESMELLTIDARLAPPLADSPRRFPLEHVSFNGGTANSHGQELVLRGESDVSADEAASFEFEHFFRTAVDVANRIDLVGNQLRHRIQGRK